MVLFSAILDSAIVHSACRLLSIVLLASMNLLWMALTKALSVICLEFLTLRQASSSFMLNPKVPTTRSYTLLRPFASIILTAQSFYLKYRLTDSTGVWGLGFGVWGLGFG